MKIIKVTEKSGVGLDAYNGNYKLVDHWYSTRDDEFKAQWCTVTIGKDEKKRPMAVFLGDKATAIKVLEEALAELRGNNKAPTKQDAPVDIPDEESIPF